MAANIGMSDRAAVGDALIAILLLSLLGWAVIWLAVAAVGALLLE